MTGLPYTYAVDIADAGGNWLNYFMGSGRQQEGESFKDIARTILARCPGTEGAQDTGWRVRVFGGTTIFAAVLGFGGAHADATIPPDLDEIATARAALAAHLALVRFVTEGTGGWEHAELRPGQVASSPWWASFADDALVTTFEPEPGQAGILRGRRVSASRAEMAPVQTTTDQ